MPETPAERVVFTLGLAAIAVLAVLVGLTWRHDHHAHAAPPHKVAAVPATTAAVDATTPKRTPRTVTATTTTTAAAPQASVRLVLRASHDTWLSVRSGSAAGRVLFTGILAAGSSRSFSGSALWTRFGAAANLRASVDGKNISLPGGTYSALITSGGLRKVA